MKYELPQAVKASLWSYDTDKINLSLVAHRSRIIQNVLNRGTKEAVDWLMQNFKKEEIAETIRHTSVSDWSKKSLSLWSLVFGASPIKKSRFV